jgi:hypothetical protein
MITRIHGATSTLAANPRKKKHNPRRRKAHKRNPGVMSLLGGKRRKARKARKARNPGLMSMLGLKKARKSRKGHARKRNPHYARKARNPGSMLVIAGVPVVEMAIGSVAAIGVGHLVDALVAKYAAGVKSSLGPAGDVLGEVATAGLAALAYKKLAKTQMHKDIAKYAFIGAVFQTISKLTEAPIKGAVDKLLPSGLKGYNGGDTNGGLYFDPYNATAAVGGSYGHLPSVSGLYSNVDTGAVAGAGLGLFNAPSIYG